VVQLTPSLRNDDATLHQHRSELIDQRGALCDQPVTGIRHYGLLASATCKANIARAKELIAAPSPSIDPSAEHVVADEAGTAADHRLPCPHCGGRMIIVESFGRSGEPRAPPP
jgi:hypothetical protein